MIVLVHSPQTDLQGTGLIADDLHLLAHDDRTGRPRLKDRPLGLVLTGGLLAGLRMCLSITVTRHGAVTLYTGSGGSPGPGPPREPLAAQIRDMISREPAPLPVADWLLFLSQTAAEGVGARLQRSGYLTAPVRGWPPWRRWREPLDAD